jgi:hypothetical protein
MRHGQLSRRSAVITSVVVAAATPLAADAATATYPVGGICPGICPTRDFPVTTAGALSAEVTVTFACSSALVRFRVDGALLFTSEVLTVGESTGAADLGPVTPGTHTLSLEAEAGGGAGCDSAAWAGTLSVTTAGVTDHDVAFVAPGDQDTVSTAVAGSPRPAGVTATLFRSQAATTAGRISVATFAGLPSGAPSDPYLPTDPYAPTDPYRAAGFLDLQLTNSDAGDVIVGEFYPTDPMFIEPVVAPADPYSPGDPYQPSDPYRLAYWNVDNWAPVFSTGGSLPTYETGTSISVTFDATSTPKVTELGGTVFAVITGLFFHGFAQPIDAGAVNVAKAGRAIPLKWQVFSHTGEPVFDLDPAITKISSVAILCDATGEPTDVLEEYATGASGLKNLGNGIFQLNWNTPKTYAGTCRRLRLDLGERNPDGTPFYRTADFQFTR